MCYLELILIRTFLSSKKMSDEKHTKSSRGKISPKSSAQSHRKLISGEDVVISKCDIDLVYKNLNNLIDDIEKIKKNVIHIESDVDSIRLNPIKHSMEKMTTDEEHPYEIISHDCLKNALKINDSDRIEYVHPLRSKNDRERFIVIKVVRTVDEVEHSQNYDADFTPQENLMKRSRKCRYFLKQLMMELKSFNADVKIKLIRDILYIEGKRFTWKDGVGVVHNCQNAVTLLNEIFQRDLTQFVGILMSIEQDENYNKPMFSEVT